MEDIEAGRLDVRVRRRGIRVIGGCIDALQSLTGRSLQTYLNSRLEERLEKTFRLKSVVAVRKYLRDMWDEEDDERNEEEKIALNVKFRCYVEAYKACGGVAAVDFEDVEVRRQTPDHTLWGARAFALTKIDHEAVDDDDWRPDPDR